MSARLHFTAPAMQAVFLTVPPTPTAARDIIHWVQVRRPMAKRLAANCLTWLAQAKRIEKVGRGLYRHWEAV